MTATPSVMMEFRCTRCWHSNCADCESSGTMVNCVKCGQSVTVPESTPERIARAEELMKLEPLAVSTAKSGTAHFEFERALSDRELLEMAKRESLVPLDQTNFSNYETAGVGPRIIAYIIDNILFSLSLFAGFVLTYWLSTLGIVKNPAKSMEYAPIQAASVLIFVFAVPSMLVMIQWIMISTSGQTIGKKMLMIRVVTIGGRLPGFFQGVVLRNWLRNLLGVIPFFTQIDLIFGFTDSGRCLHDWFSNTRVVNVG